MDKKQDKDLSRNQGIKKEKVCAARLSHPSSSSYGCVSTSRKLTSSFSLHINPSFIHTYPLIHPSTDSSPPDTQSCLVSLYPSLWKRLDMGKSQRSEVVKGLNQNELLEGRRRALRQVPPLKTASAFFAPPFSHFPLSCASAPFFGYVHMFPLLPFFLSLSLTPSYSLSPFPPLSFSSTPSFLPTRLP